MHYYYYSVLFNLFIAKEYGGKTKQRGVFVLRCVRRLHEVDIRPGTGRVVLHQLVYFLRDSERPVLT